MELVIEGDGYSVIKRENGKYGYLIGNQINGSFDDPEDAEFAALERASWLGFQDNIQYRVIDNWKTWDLDDLLHSTAMWTHAVNNVWNDELKRVHQKLIDEKQIEKWSRVIKFGITHWCPDHASVEAIISLNKTIATSPAVTDIIVVPMGVSDSHDGVIVLLTMLDKNTF